MSDLSHAAIYARMREEADRLLIDRLRISVWVTLAAMPVYALGDFYSHQPALIALSLVKLAVVAMGIWALRSMLQPVYQERARVFGVTLVAILCVTSAISGSLTGDYAAHTFLVVMIALFGGTVAPWGAVSQVLAVLIATISAAACGYAATGSLQFLVAYPSVIVAVACITSVYMAHVLEQSRLALAEENLAREQAQTALAEEAQTSAALARIGQGLMTTAQSPALLQRLCELTAEVLNCEYSWSLLRKMDEDVYVLAAHHGATSIEPSESIGMVSLAESVAAELIERLQIEPVVLLTSPDPAAARYGIAARLYVALRRGDEIIGFHAAGYRRSEAIAPPHRRILQGIAHLASLALETARLVEQLERVGRFRADFVANMSHELRTPMNAILGYQDLLLDGAFGALTADQTDPLQHANRRARELLDLINATLALSRLEARRAPLDLYEIRVTELVEDLAPDLAAPPSKPGLSVTWHVDPLVPTLRTDVVKLRMVLKNLVQNAIKFTSEGTVSITVRRHNEGVEFAVRDTGIGIAAEAQAAIFEPFHQVDAANAQQSGGVGLGLYIVRRLLELLGGTIAVESQLGSGTTFRVWIPLDVSALRVRPAVAAEDTADRVSSESKEAISKLTQPQRAGPTGS